MAFSSWRGVVGMINPTMRPGVTEEVIRLLPEGIGLIPLFLNIRRGTADEFETMMPHYEKLVAVLAEQKCDLIHPHGAPPFMVLGRKGEAEIVTAWEKKYKTPIMSVAQNHVRALKALKAKSIVGATYFPPKLNAIFAKYFTRRRLHGARHGRHRRAVRQGAGALGRAGLRPHQAQFSQSERRRRDLHARLRLAHARHHRDAGAGPAGAGGASGARPACGKFRSGCTCASRGKASAICWQRCRKRDEPCPIGYAQRWSFCFGPCAASRWRPPGKRQRSRSSSSTRAAPSRCWSAPRRAASTTSRRAWWREHLGRFIPGNPTIVVQNNPGAGGLVTANRLYQQCREGRLGARQARARGAAARHPGRSERPVRSDKVHLARQPVVLRQRRLSAAGQRQSRGQDHRRAQGARHVGHARRRQLRRRAI